MSEMCIHFAHLRNIDVLDSRAGNDVISANIALRGSFDDQLCIRHPIN